MKKIAIIGAGQHGGSIARRLVEHSDYNISVYDHDDEAYAELGNFVGEDQANAIIKDSYTDVVRDADIVMFATPIDEFGPIMQRISPNLKDGAIVTDIGSGKVKAIQEIEKYLPQNVDFVPAHPIAGAAQSGTAASNPNMYDDQAIIIVPRQENLESGAQETVEKLWEDMGGKIAHMEARPHDFLYGTISHFEHVFAFPLIAMGEMEHYQKAGNSMLDTTRIGGGASPDMWIPIFKDNKDAILSAAGGFRERLASLRQALNDQQPKALNDLLEQAHDFRIDIEETRPREMLEREIDEIAEEFQVRDVNLSDAASIEGYFNDEAKTAMIKRTLLPVMLGAAVTLNAKDTEEKYLDGLKIADLANPSFKDGSAPMLNDPEYLTNLLYYNRDMLNTELDRYENELNTFCTTIENENPDEIRVYIEQISEKRLQMPTARNPEYMGDAFKFSIFPRKEMREEPAEGHIVEI